MFGSEVLDVAIGLVVVYLLLSLFATAVREALESVFKTRAVFLETGVRELLDDRRGRGLSRQLYEHPLIASLYIGPYDPASDPQAPADAPVRERLTGANLPTYIPAPSFAAALIDLMVRGPASGPDSELQRAPLTFDSLRTGVELIDSPHVRRALFLALDDAKGDLDRAKANIEQWFDRSMDRVSGWYRRRTHYWLLFIGVASTLALNVNTIAIAQHLARSKAARELVVGKASAIVADSLARAAAAGVPNAPTPIDPTLAHLDARLTALAALELPIGWEHMAPVVGPPFSWFVQQVVGLLLTALAITLGAPFWFDALNKVMQVKTTGASGTRRATSEETH
ncbi:MAG: hypothetical protein IT359_09885 [Gemmatimonadaceae bacterium]|nr:hypothetical protein [Gemmatimonadaceae bacterium]